MITPPAALEALLFTAGEPLEKKRLANFLALTEEQLAAVIEALDRSLEGHGVTLIETDTDVELRTSPLASDILKSLRDADLARDLGKGSLETLAVIAYQGGVSKSEIDWVRGVNSSASLRTLLTRGLIEGREDTSDKRRIRYTMTTEALAHLGVARSTDLPRADELRTAAHAAIEEKPAALSDTAAM
ncbi:MAG: SMC-Scp complex subunit ScpB [Minisyncoccota bacterium]